jgi:hypothetical protein
MKRLLTVAVAVASLLTWSCSESPSPTSPSTSSPSGSAAVPDSVGSSWLTAGSARVSASWSCLTEGVGCAARGAPLTSVPAAAIAPGTPGNLMFFVNGSTVNLGWLGPTTGDAPTSYVLEAGSGPGLSNILVFDTGSTAAGFQATSVPAGTYFVRLRARNSAGTSGASNEVTIIIAGGGGGPGPCNAAPNAPTNLSFSANGSNVNLFWNPPVGGCPLTTYALRAGSSPGGSNLADFGTGNTSTSFTATNVPPGTYFVRVLAGNGNGFGPSSNEVTVVTGSGGGTLTILPAVLPTLRVGVPISIALSVVGGTGTGWSFSPNNIGSQIPGLSINTPSPGFLSGTPTTAGPYLRGFSVSDSGGNTGSVTYSGTVLP